MKGVVINMEVVVFDEDILKNQSIRRNINQIYNIFYPDKINSNYQIVTIAEYYEANQNILNSYSKNLRDRIELVPFIYKTCLYPSNEEYTIFRKDYFKQIILSYLFSQKLPLTSYKINKNEKNLIKLSSNSSYEEMVNNKFIFNDILVSREEVIKFLFQYYLNDIIPIVKDLNDNQPKYFENIKKITNLNIQPNNIPSFMNIVISNYKRLIVLYKVYASEDIRKKTIIEQLLKEKEDLINNLNKVNKKLENEGGNGRSLTFKSGTASSKLFMYDNENGFIQNLLFIFLVGLTSGLSFFFVSSLIKFILKGI